MSRSAEDEVFLTITADPGRAIVVPNEVLQREPVIKPEKWIAQAEVSMRERGADQFGLLVLAHLSGETPDEDPDGIADPSRAVKISPAFGLPHETDFDAEIWSLAVHGATVSFGAKAWLRRLLRVLEETTIRP